MTFDEKVFIRLTCEHTNQPIAFRAKRVVAYRNNFVWVEGGDAAGAPICAFGVKETFGQIDAAMRDATAH